MINNHRIHCFSINFEIIQIVIVMYPNTRFHSCFIHSADEMICNKPQALSILIRNLLCNSVANKIIPVIVRYYKGVYIADTTECARCVLILLKTNVFHLSELYPHSNDII
jgi:hypothetical protein